MIVFYVYICVVRRNSVRFEKISILAVVVYCPVFRHDIK